jgi:hypothetical protein
VALAAKRLGRDPRRGVATVRWGWLWGAHPGSWHQHSHHERLAGGAMRQGEARAPSCHTGQPPRWAWCPPGEFEHWARLISPSTSVPPRRRPRFFGKFLGTHADYYVFETTLQAPPPEPEQAAAGARMRRAAARERTQRRIPRCLAWVVGLLIGRPSEEGRCAPCSPRRAAGLPSVARPGEGGAPVEWNSGANGYAYFVCNAPGGPLVQLPHVTPAQVKAARRIKKLLTGRLTSQVGPEVPWPGCWGASLCSGGATPARPAAPKPPSLRPSPCPPCPQVSGYPVFPGTEANYLRTQVGRQGLEHRHARKSGASWRRKGQAGVAQRVSPQPRRLPRLRA